MKLKTSRTGLEIAVIGMAGSFPGASNTQEFWSNLIGGNSSVSLLSDEELLAAGVHRELLNMANFIRAKGVFPGIEYFDAAFFDYTPRDASLMDPQVRVMHQCVYHALEDAGYISEHHRGSIGLFAGSSGNFVWELSTLLDTKDSAAAQFATIQLNDKDFVATRIAYKLNLRGPCVTVHCACSTSLYAIDLACRQLLTGACSMAVAAGSGLNLPHKNGYVYEEGMILSSDGVCRPFSEDSNGTIEGNGMGAVVLKPLEDAIRDRDRIYAVIRGTGANNDGSRKVGYTAPSVEGQAEAIRRALHMAEVDPLSISYVEAHGTGTALGDPVEIEGLKRAFRTEHRGYCGIGSLKSNIGHLDTAAGISSFIKTVLALKHRFIPPSINFRASNPEIDFANSPFYVVTELRRWQNPPVESSAYEAYPLRAGVSSFGIGGTNVHVILEEAPELPPSSAGREWKLLCLSAADAPALARLEEAVVNHVLNHPEQDLNDLAYTLQTGRRDLRQRRALVFRDHDDLSRQFKAGAEGEAAARRYTNIGKRAQLVFLMSGQGTQYPGMALGLYRSEPGFREALERCLAICDRQGLPQVRSLLMNATPTQADMDAMNGTDLSQPSLFAVEYANASMLMGWGLQPTGMIGHSLGEYVAACLAGVMSLEHALELVIKRGRLMREMLPGAMLAVAAAADDLATVLPVGVDIAALNGPQQCTVSGAEALIEELAQVLHVRGVQAKRLHTSHAFHSAMMEPMLASFRRVLADITLAAPQIPYVSNVSGTWITAEQAQDPEYYARHLRGTIRFAAGAETLLEDADAVFVEIGPGNVLGAFVKQCAGDRAPVVVSMLRHTRTLMDDAQYLARALGDLWGQGALIDWRRYYQQELRSRVDAPLYPFAQQAYPIGRGDIYSLLESVSSLTTASADISAVMTMGWSNAMLPALDDSSGVRPCLAIVENRKLVKPLSLVSGLRVIQCHSGDSFAAMGSGRYAANLDRSTDYRRLIHALKLTDGVPGLIVWLADKMAGAANMRALLDRLLRLAMVLSSESPGQCFRVLLALPGARAEADDEALGAEMDASLRSLRANCLQLDVRAVMFDGKMSAISRAKLLEREVYDTDRETVLSNYAKDRRQVYSLQPLPVTASAVRFQGRCIGLLVPDYWPGAELAARISDASGARVLPISVSVQRDTSHTSMLGVGATEIRGWLRADQQQDFGRYGLKDFSRCHDLLDEACTLLVAHYVDSCLPLQAGRSFTRDELSRAMRVSSNHQKYVDYMLAMLREDGLLLRDADTYSVLREVTALRDIVTIREELRTASPLFSGNLQVLEHCVAAFPLALSEEIPPITVLYPDGTSQMLQRAYSGSIQELEEEVIRITFEKLFQQIVRRAAGRPIRILEAGGGFGLTMRRLAPMLRGVEVEYYFTDVGRTFLHDAREFALSQGYDFFSFGIFDISRDPQEQGLTLHSFDLVFAFNVVHATNSLAVSVGNLRSLLRDGGYMCLLERTRVRRYIDLIWGLAEGWWHFDDNERSLSPLIDLEQWQQVASAAGFAEVMSFPESEEARRCLECGILIAQTPVASQSTPAATPERWQIDAPAETLDGVILIDDVEDRPREAFEPFGDGLITAKLDIRARGQAVLGWLKSQRPAFVSVWAPGMALANAPDQIARTRTALELDSKGGALPGVTSWSRIHMPLGAGSAGCISLPPMALLNQALRLMHGGVDEVVLSAAELNLFKPPQTGSESANSATSEMPALQATAAIEGGGVEHYEALVHKLWAELFGIERIGVDEDFFELGGDSLKVAQLTAELEKYGIKLMSNEVFNHPTIRSLARYLHDNRQSEHGSIRSVQALLEHFRKEVGVEAIFHTVLHEGCPLRILFLSEAVFAREASPDKLLADLRLPMELQPNHVLPMTRCPANINESSAAEVWHAIGLDCTGSDHLLQRLTATMKTGMEELNHQIFKGELVRSYPLSPFQKMFMQESNRVAFYLIDFDEPIDFALLNRALTDVVGLQGLMRSRLRRNRLRRLVWDEYAAPQTELTIPVADLSGCSPGIQSELMEKLMELENAADFNDTGNVMYRVTLLRFDRCRHTLFFNMDHSIFDNMSGQVLRRQLLSRYRQLRAGSTAAMEPVKSFGDYLEQLNRGPQGITKQKLIEIFDLVRYDKVKNAVEERIVARRQPQIKKLRFELDLDQYQLSDDDDSTWEVSLSVLCCTLGRFLEQDAVPLKIVYQGRQYQDLSYFDTLGLFIDVLPLLVPVDRENPVAMIEGIRRKVRFVNRYNVSFMNMLLNVSMRFKWWDVLSPLNPRKLTKRDPMILLNYVGKAEAEYQKIIDFSSRQMEGAKGNLGYASLYLIVTRVDRTILFDVFCNFEKDMSKLARFFEEEATRLLRPAKVLQAPSSMQQRAARATADSVSGLADIES